MQKQFLHIDSHIRKKEVKQEFVFLENLAEEITFERGNRLAVQGRGLLPDIVAFGVKSCLLCLLFD